MKVFFGEGYESVIIIENRLLNYIIVQSKTVILSMMLLLKKDVGQDL